ncbi:hypothetical protein T484DRAFT_1874570 [Baffinella frigidus]|nr:hypothetical protein T484DRAFT_1874570 [Cryptophyta sp. CCMP2293]
MSAGVVQDMSAGVVQDMSPGVVQEGSTGVVQDMSAGVVEEGSGESMPPVSNTPVAAAAYCGSPMQIVQRPAPSAATLGGDDEEITNALQDIEAALQP